VCACVCVCLCVCHRRCSTVCIASMRAWHSVVGRLQLSTDQLCMLTRTQTHPHMRAYTKTFHRYKYCKTHETRTHTHTHLWAIMISYSLEGILAQSSCCLPVRVYLGHWHTHFKGQS